MLTLQNNKLNNLLHISYMNVWPQTDHFGEKVLYCDLCVSYLSKFLMHFFGRKKQHGGPLTERTSPCCSGTLHKSRHRPASPFSRGTTSLQLGPALRPTRSSLSLTGNMSLDDGRLVSLLFLNNKINNMHQLEAWHGPSLQEARRNQEDILAVSIAYPVGYL